ncbi:MAG: dTDP-4-dehydrorhamnose 3,5-epimerase [Candidatus Marinimicrobia bacterium]|nr:dTDP-4-dehydrorhamnose 3,5-epimerase [Candidatus Neomarinimicrobiota bacterium]
MQIIKTDIPDVIQLRPKVFSDLRGNFRETFRDTRLAEAGIDVKFVQDNLVHSKKNVFRGLHFQTSPYEQAKLITLISGEILDFVLDLRRDSETFLKLIQIRLSAENEDQLFIPEGLAHGYYVLSKESCISYKVSAPYAPEHQAGIHWDDQSLNLGELVKNPILSEQDKALPTLNEILSKYEF